MKWNNIKVEIVYKIHSCKLIFVENHKNRQWKEQIKYASEWTDKQFMNLTTGQYIFWMPPNQQT